MEGLEVSIIPFSQIPSDSRFDPEFFQKFYLEMEMMLKNRGAKKLGEVCLLYDGPFGSDLLAEDYDEQGVPLLRMQNITETGSSNLEDVQLISQESAARMDKYHVFPGELVVTKIGFLGHSTVLPNDYPVYVFRREMTKMIPKKPSEFLPEALAAYFNGKFGRDQFYRYASGCHRSPQNAPPVITSKCTTSDGCFLLG